MSDENGSVLPDWIPTSEPSWWSDASRVIGGIVGVSAGGIALVDDPVAFVRAAIAEWIVGGIVSVFGFISLALERGLGGTLTSLRAVQNSVFFSLIGVWGALLAPIQSIEETLITLTVAAGPFSFLVSIVAFAAVAIVTFLLGRLLIEVARFI